MKKLILVVLVCGFATTMGVIFTACKDDPPQKPYNPLEATTWKFIGFYDVEADTLKEVVYNCDNVCIIMFFEDSSIYIRSSLEHTAPFYWIYYTINYELSVISFNRAFIDQTQISTICFDILTFENAMMNANNIMFEHKENTLKIYYNKNKNYLLYEEVK